MVSLKFLVLYLIFLPFSKSLTQKCESIFTTVILAPTEEMKKPLSNKEFTCPPSVGKDINLFQRSQGIVILSLTANFNLIKEANSSLFFNLYNLTVLSLDESVYTINYIQPWLNGVLGNNTTPVNNFDLKLPVNTTSLKLTLGMAQGDPDNIWDYSITYLMIDQESFSLPDGSLFSSKKPTYTIMLPSGFLNTLNITYTCTSFKEVNDSQITAPRCKAFKSRSTVYNADDNYSIYATIKANYTLNENYIVASYDTDIPDTWTVNIISYDYCQCDNKYNCYIPYSKKDGKIFFFVLYSNYQALSSGEIVNGRIINQNEQTLMDDKNPFTKQNDCIYFTDTMNYKIAFVTTTQFCCISFED
jgi:hypothetical protein